MTPRRIRPAQPLAPHGLPGHLVGFVEALRARGIAVGPSETVDAGRVLATLGLGSREVMREGLACALLRRPDHRDTYDALFDLWWPAALGARTILDETDATDDGDDAPGLPAEDIEMMRDMLLDLLADNEDLAAIDDRLLAMIAAIVEAHGRYQSGRGPSYSSYQALKAMALDADRQINCRPADYRGTQDGRGGNQTTHRRTAGPRARADLRHPRARRERRVPARLR